MNLLTQELASAPSYREITLTKGQVAWVSECDYASLITFKWYANKHYKGFYRAMRVDEKKNPVYMHRQIMGLVPGDGLEVDHINRNELDNRRENLRVCTREENVRNQAKRITNTSGFKGVSRKRGKWRATIFMNWKQISLGSFDTPELAYEAYCAAAKRLHGEFARG